MSKTIFASFFELRTPAGGNRRTLDASFYDYSKGVDKKGVITSSVSAAYRFVHDLEYLNSLYTCAVGVHEFMFEGFRHNLHDSHTKGEFKELNADNTPLIAKKEMKVKRLSRFKNAIFLELANNLKQQNELLNNET